MYRQRSQKIAQVDIAYIKAIWRAFLIDLCVFYRDIFEWIKICFHLNCGRQYRVCIDICTRSNGNESMMTIVRYWYI